MPIAFRYRAAAALASALILLGLVAALVIGLAAPVLRPQPAGTLVAIAVMPSAERQETRPRPDKTKVRRRSGGSPEKTAPLGPIAPSAPVLAIIPLPPPLPARVEAPASGAAADGAGSGGAGTGSGGGTGEDTALPYRPAQRARQIRGHLSPGDVPDGVLPPGGSAAVGVRYVVGLDGRVTGCTVIAASGLATIDAIPCPLIERRFRFRPARDARGQAVPETIVETHTWFEPERRPRAGGAALPTPRFAP